MDRNKYKIREAKTYDKRYKSVACNMIERGSFMNSTPAKNSLLDDTKHWRYNCNRDVEDLHEVMDSEEIC